MIGKDPASGIEENAGRAFFQSLPSPRPGVAAYCFDQGLERAARIARGMSAGHNGALVLARRMQEPLGVLRGSRGGRANYLYALSWHVLIGLRSTHGAAVSFAPPGSPPIGIAESGAWSLRRLPGARRANSGGTEATFSLGGRNSRYRFHSGPGLKARDRVRLSRFRCIAGA